MTYRVETFYSDNQKKVIVASNFPSKLKARDKVCTIVAPELFGEGITLSSSSDSIKVIYDDGSWVEHTIVPEDAVFTLSVKVTAFDQYAAEATLRETIRNNEQIAF
jgi:hypothetical protein